MDNKQRSLFRSEAQALSPVVMVGKNGVTAEVVDALKEALKLHELVKVKFQAFKKDTKEMSTDLEKKTKSELVGVTGFTAVFYKFNSKNHK